MTSKIVFRLAPCSQWYAALARVPRAPPLSVMFGAGDALHRRGPDELGVCVRGRRVQRRGQREVGVARRDALRELLVRALAEIVDVAVAGLDVAEVVVLADRHEALAREGG